MLKYQNFMKIYWSKKSRYHHNRRFFSSGGGPNSAYYQDFIAREYNFKIANLDIIKNVRSTFEIIIQKSF